MRIDTFDALLDAQEELSELLLGAIADASGDDVAFLNEQAKAVANAIDAINDRFGFYL